MHINSARFILNLCDRSELRDHAFGDVEVFWAKNGKEIASGYFGGGHAEVYMTPTTKFTEDDARSLRDCGVLQHVERNDETGPDEFTLGAIMPGLTKGAVLDEITRPPTTLA